MEYDWLNYAVNFFEFAHTTNIFPVPTKLVKMKISVSISVIHSHNFPSRWRSQASLADSILALQSVVMAI